MNVHVSNFFELVKQEWNYPSYEDDSKLKGRVLEPYIDYMIWNEQTRESDIPAVIIVGKRKPLLAIEGNEKRIANYIDKFEKLVEQYRQE